MSKLTIRKYKWELQQKLEIIPSGKRHKDFDYPIFINLPSDWQITKNTPYDKNEVRTAICFAGDVRKNYIEYYILTEIDWDKKQVKCYVLDDGDISHQASYYIDSVALIPYEIIPPRTRLELLKPDELLEQDRKNRQRRKAVKEAEKIK